MIKISNGMIKLEDKILDLSNFQIRPKITEKDLEKYYDSFIDHVFEIRDYFEDTAAFDKSVKEAADEKRPKLIPRETKYPFMWAFRSAFSPFDYLRPSERRLNDKYFLCSKLITRISRKTKPKFEAPLDNKLREEISKKFEKYPGYEAIIEIPDDGTSPQTKASSFHEALHYVFLRYSAETGRNFVDAIVRKELPQLLDYQLEATIHEKVTENLTDKLLIHDPEAQFHSRWLHYSLDNNFIELAYMLSAMSAGILLGSSIINPYMLPLTLVPGRVRDYILKRQKESKKEEILTPIKYPIFKI